MVFFNVGIIGQKFTEKTSLKPRLLDKFFAKLLRVFSVHSCSIQNDVSLKKMLGAVFCLLVMFEPLFLLEKTYIQFLYT